LTFTQHAMLVIDTANETEITIERHDGTDGIVSCKYRTKPDTKNPVKHPDPIEGEITFNHGEVTFHETIKSRARSNKF